jgi:hypothetical protein
MENTIEMKKKIIANLKKVQDVLKYGKTYWNGEKTEIQNCAYIIKQFL